MQELLETARAARRRDRRARPRAGAARRSSSAERFEHIPAELLAHQIRGAAALRRASRRSIEHALREGWPLDAERIACPVRVVWGTADRLLPWPSRRGALPRRWLPHADWVELDGVGHCPQLDVPLETAQLILGFTAS